MTKRAYSIRVFKSTDGQWRSNLSRNGRVVADSAESYHRLSGLLARLENMARDLYQPGSYGLIYSAKDRPQVEACLAKHCPTLNTTVESMYREAT